MDQRVIVQDEELKVVVQRLVDAYEPERIYLFGCRASPFRRCAFLSCG